MAMMNRMRRKRDLGIVGRTARWYDRNTREHRLDEMRGYARQVAAQIGEGARVLEIAPGPGYLAIELAKLGHYAITGMDISPDFVAIARRNAGKEGVAVDFREGNVAAMPFADGAFDFIICTAAFKNFRDPQKALGEMHRVLAPGGTAQIVDMNRDVTNAQIDALTRQMGVKGLEELFLKVTFKYFLRRGAYNQAELKELAAQTAFRDCSIAAESVGLTVHLRKQAERATRPAPGPPRAA